VLKSSTIKTLILALDKVTVDIISNNSLFISKYYKTILFSGVKMVKFSISVLYKIDVWIFAAGKKERIF